MPPDSLTFERVMQFSGQIRPPSDKSLTHRALIFGALANESSQSTIINNPLMGEDCLNTRAILQKLGKNSTIGQHSISIPSNGKLSGTELVLDCGNSGTTMRLLSGLFAGISGLKVELIGDDSLSRRPMGRVVKPLRQMGADIFGETAPIKISGKQLSGIDYQSPVASAQIKSAILLAGLNASSEVTISEPYKSRDHTERMLTSLGVKLEYPDDKTVKLKPGQSWDPFEFNVPGDISSAAFWLVAASLFANSKVMLTEVGINPTRSGILDVLQQVGVLVTQSNFRSELGEPVADLEISSVADLQPFTISGDLVPKLIDEIPVLCILATQCQGTSIVSDAAELRVKETDRISIIGDGLLRMGANVELRPDGLVIHGSTPLNGIQIDSRGDHRIGMSFAIAASIAQGKTEILNSHSIKTSYPNFVEDYQTLAQF